MLVRAVRVAALVLVWALAASHPGLAQIFTGEPAASAAPALQPGIRQEGIYTTAPISLDGALLFRIAALQNASPDQLSITLRQSYIVTALGEALATTGSSGTAATVYDPTSIIVQIRRDGDQASLDLVDRTHRDGLPLLTITTVDGRYHQLSVDALAAQWQGILQAALEQALLKRQPAFQRASLLTVAEVGVGLVALTFLAGIGITVLRRRIRALEREILEAKPAPADGPEPEGEVPAEPRGAQRRLLLDALRKRAPAERLALLHSAIGVVIWAVLLIWLAAITWAMSLFPQTTPLAHVVARRAIAVVAIWIFAGLLIRVLDVAITRWAAWQFGTFGSPEERARALLRGPTISTSVGGFSRFTVTFLAVLLGLSQIGIPVGSVVTIGGVAAIAVTFAAQNFVRDFIGGFLVLFEDQYVVGDFITVNGISGLVENLTLRMVQVRDASQNLITIPHGSVSTVRNESRYWSGLDYRVSIDQHADALKAMELVKAAIEPPATLEWIGLDALDRDYVTIRASVKTGPLLQFQLHRDLNDRVYRAFAQEGIGFGAPPVA
jgi:small conductance mechanosensitive channel